MFLSVTLHLAAAHFLTFLDVPFDSLPLIRSTAPTDGTHEDHPVMESNVVHE